MFIFPSASPSVWIGCVTFTVRFSFNASMLILWPRVTMSRKHPCAKGNKVKKQMFNLFWPSFLLLVQENVFVHKNLIIINKHTRNGWGCGFHHYWCWWRKQEVPQIYPRNWDLATAPYHPTRHSLYAGLVVTILWNHLPPSVRGQTITSFKPRLKTLIFW